MTPFGRFMRNLRLDRGMLLKNVADKLQVTSAYLSALEHGKKGVPNDVLVSKLQTSLELNRQQKKELIQAVRDSASSVSISYKSTPLAFETANAFARKLPNLSEKQLKSIKVILEKD